VKGSEGFVRKGNETNESAVLVGVERNRDAKLVRWEWVLETDPMDRTKTMGGRQGNECHVDPLVQQEKIRRVDPSHPTT